MNIFVLARSPAQSAKFHCDQHLVKMILESVQMLCTVNHKLKVSAPYKTAHPHHPCTVWAGESLANYLWLRELAFELEEERYYRRLARKPHSSISVLRKLRIPAESKFPFVGLTPHALAMPDCFIRKCTVSSYRAYYASKHFATWTGRAVPRWLKEYL